MDQLDPQLVNDMAIEGSEWDIRDKKNWGPGDWNNEPDEETFVYRGFTCSIQRVFGGGHLCGYVYLPAGHKYHGQDYKDIDKDIDIEVHGGITYSNEQEDGTYKIGFDCAHLNDITPGYEYNMKLLSSRFKEFKELDDMSKELIKRSKIPDMWKKTYKNIEFVRNECKSMVDQLIDEKE